MLIEGVERRARGVGGGGGVTQRAAAPTKVLYGKVWHPPYLAIHVLSVRAQGHDQRHGPPARP